MHQISMNERPRSKRFKETRAMRPDKTKPFRRDAQAGEGIPITGRLREMLICLGWLRLFQTIASASHDSDCGKAFRIEY